MLAILFLYFVGKYYYDLSLEFNKNKWGFSILGIAMYFFGTIAFGFCVGVSNALWDTTTFSDDSGMLIEFIAMPFGILACWGTYRILKKRWTKNSISTDTELLDDQFIN